MKRSKQSEGEITPWPIDDGLPRALEEDAERVVASAAVHGACPPRGRKEGDRQRHSARARVRSWTAERGAEAPALLWKLEWNSIRFGSRVRAWVGDAMERIIFGRGIRSGRAALSWRLRAARRERGRANAERGVAEWVG
jgi:hypothetical protein